MQCWTKTVNRMLYLMVKDRLLPDFTKTVVFPTYWTKETLSEKIALLLYSQDFWLMK